MLSSLRQCCQQNTPLSPCYQPLPGLFLSLFVRKTLASYGAIGQRERGGRQWHLTELNELITRIIPILK